VRFGTFRQEKSVLGKGWHHLRQEYHLRKVAFKGKSLSDVTNPTGLPEKR